MRKELSQKWEKTTSWCPIISVLKCSVLKSLYVLYEPQTVTGKQAENKSKPLWFSEYLDNWGVELQDMLYCYVGIDPGQSEYILQFFAKPTLEFTQWHPNSCHAGQASIFHLTAALCKRTGARLKELNPLITTDQV